MKSKFKKNQVDLTEGSIIKKMLIVAIPTVLLALVNSAYSIVDLYFLGQVGEIGLDNTEVISGVGTAGFLIWLAFGFILLSKVGTDVLVSQSVGKKDQENVEKIAMSGIVLTVLIGFIYSVMTYLFSQYLFDLYDISENAKDYAYSYIKIWSFVFIPYFLISCMGGIFNAVGKSIVTFSVGTIGLIINIILDPIFILNFEMGVEGAAIATLISNYIVMFIYIIIFMTKYKPVKLKLSRFNFESVKKIFKMGTTPGVQAMVFCIISMIMGGIVAGVAGINHADSATTAQRVGSQIESLSWMVAGGFSTALSAFVGQNFGATKNDRIKKGVKSALKVIFIYSMILTIVFYFFAENIYRLFLDDNSGETLEIGITYLRILSLSQFFLVAEITMQGAFNGLSKPKYAAIISMSVNILRIVLAIVLGYQLGLESIWWIISITALLKGVLILGIYYLRIDKILLKNEKNESLEV